MVRIQLIFLVLMWTAMTLYSQDTTQLTGKIIDSLSGEALESVAVQVLETGSGTYTDVQGHFQIIPDQSLPVTLRFSYVGYNPKSIRITSFMEDIQVMLSPTAEQLTEVVVQANSFRERFNSTNTSVETIEARQAEVLPALFGEVDIIKTLQLKPGISSGSEGSSSLFVRGGSGDQNLVLFDRVNIYNPSHLFGFFSTFNNDALSSVDVFKGGFPAEYGGRLSSVLDITTRQPGNDKLSGSGGIGIISSRLTLDGPIVKDKINFLISGRRTYIDIFTELFNKTQADNEEFTPIPRYRFYDLNGKLTANLSDRDKLTFNGYLGADVFGFNADFISADFDWGNRAGSLNWNHAFNDRLYFNTTAFFSRYKYHIANESGEFGFRLGSEIEDLGARWDLTFNHPQGQFIKAGIQWIQHKFTIGSFKIASEADDVEFSAGSSPEGQEFAAYLRDEFSPWKPIKLNIGVRYSGFLTRGHWYHNVEPRVSFAATINDRWNLKSSYARMNQYIHLVTSSGVSLPTDIWFPTTERVKPQVSDQYVIGFNYLISPSILLTNEYYYKNFQNQIELKDHSQIFVNDDFENEFTFGDGEAWGTEIGLEKQMGKWTGWIGYTLAWVQRGNFKDIDGGAWFPPQFDRRHDLSVVSSYRFNDKWTISTTFVYGSGDKAWLPAGRFYLQDIDAYNNFPVVPIYQERNTITMPPYHRMDLSVVRSWKTNWGEHNLSLSIYNLYDRRNPYFIYLDTELEDVIDGPQNLDIPIRVSARQVSLFPVLPSISWNFKF